jgi:hypothetical protein
MISRRLVALFAVAAIALSGGGAFAHKDKNPETNAQRCDRWYRDGTGTDDTPYDDNHNGQTWDDGPATSANDPANTQIVNEGGHYVVRNDHGYVEVVGGQDYRRPLGNPEGARGGYVQGEIDPVNPTSPNTALVPGGDADFHVSTFSGVGNTSGPYMTYAEANACLTVMNTFILDQWMNRNPPTD